MQIIIVAAISDNQVLGKNNDLPWHLPADLRFFNQTIAGAWLLTGRKSYESAQGKALFSKDRNFIVLTRRTDYQAESGWVVNSLDEAINLAKEKGAATLCILGGANIYKQAMAFADKMVITEVHACFEGDTFFSKISPNQWKETSRIRFSKDEENQFDYSFVSFERNRDKRIYSNI